MRSPSATSSGPTVNMMMRCDSPTCDMLAPFTGALGAATRCHSEERRLSFAKATSMWLPVRRTARLDPQRAQSYRVTALVGAESFESIEACGWRPPVRRRGDRRECRMLREAEAVAVSELSGFAEVGCQPQNTQIGSSASSLSGRRGDETGRAADSAPSVRCGGGSRG